MNRYNLIFLIIFFTFILPGPPTTPITSEDQYNKLQIFKSHAYDSYHHLENTTFNENFGNLTGFMLSYGDVLNGEVNQTYPLPHKQYNKWANNQNYSILPDEITSEAFKIWNLEQEDPIDSKKNYYPNISASIHGEFKKINNSFVNLPLQLPSYLENFNPQSPNIPINNEVNGYVPKLEGNVTNDHGLIKFELDIIDSISRKYFNKLDSKIKLINIDFELSDFDELNKHSIETRGFYFVESGNIITSTNSAKFFSFYGGLQHLLFSENYLNYSKELSLSYLNETLFKTMDINSNVDLNFNYLTQLLEKSQNHCEYISYFHLDKVNLSKNEIENIDKELINPIGRPIDFSNIPGLNLTGLLYSPDCSIQISIPSSSGIRREVQLASFHKVVMAGIVLLLVQIILILKQMNYSNTPSTISRVSFWTICTLSLVDGSLAMLYLVSSAILNRLYLPLTVSAFLAFILASIFEMRFMISIYISQMNERTINLFTALQGRPLDEERENNNDTTPAAQQDEAQISGTIYTRFFFTLIIFTFVMLNSAMWPKHIRTKFEYFAIFVLNSYWLPQVYRNVVKGSHRSFKWWFVIGTTIVRTSPIFYVFIIKSNVFQHHYDPNYFIFLISWIGLQLSLLFLQGLFGARFFLPKSLLPQTYNYHPLLTESDIENGFGIEQHDSDYHDNTNNNDQNSINSSSPVVKNLDNGHCSVDCSICMTEVQLPIMKSNIDQAATFLQRRNYMVTPCRHIFHSQCLEAWMKYKLQCPVCRNSLPPL